MKCSIFFIFLFVFLVQGREIQNGLQNGVSRIVGGSSATNGQFPFIASLIRNRNTHICGGTIIAKRWVMSAGHCIIARKEELVLLVGTVVLSQGGDVHEIENIIVHEKYNKVTQKNDISLLNTKNEIKYSKNVQPLKLAMQPPPAGIDVVLLGWGLVQTNPEKYPTTLQWMKSKTIDMAECKSRAGRPGGTELDKTQTCLLSSLNHGPCSGDSGGPAVITRNGESTVIGVASFVLGKCATNKPDIYTSVSEFKAWIDKHIK